MKLYKCAFRARIIYEKSRKNENYFHQKSPIMHTVCIKSSNLFRTFATALKEMNISMLAKRINNLLTIKIKKL